MNELKNRIIHLNFLTKMEDKIFWTLRIAAGFCFIGHGAFGIITKSEWLPFFAFAHIGSDMAYNLMPLIGMMDILLGMLAIFYPTRIFFMWMTVWAIWTALLRPFTGMGIWEFFERAGNYGIPLVMLMWVGLPSSFKAAFRKIEIVKLSNSRYQLIQFTLRIVIALLLLGHGGFGAFQQKTILISHWQTVGMPGPFMGSEGWLQLIGWFEIILAFRILVKPGKGILIFAIMWKIGTELLYPLSGSPIWEFVERWGSYFSPLALFFIIQWQQIDHQKRVQYVLATKGGLT